MKKGIVIIGMPGCGKTTFGQSLAKKLDYKFLDMDYFIESSTKKSISEIFEKSGEAMFREFETKTCEVLSRLNKCVIATGGGVVKKAENMNYYKDFVIVFINTPLEIILDDININTRPLLKDGKANLVNIYRERIDLYNQYADVIVAGDADTDIVVSDIIEKTREYLV